MNVAATLGSLRLSETQISSVPFVEMAGRPSSARHHRPLLDIAPHGDKRQERNAAA